MKAKAEGSIRIRRSADEKFLVIQGSEFFLFLGYGETILRTLKRFSSSSFKFNIFTE